MSRLVPTAEEKYARQLLENYLQQQQIDYDIDEYITDSPDLVFISNGERFACEFTKYNQQYPVNTPPETDQLMESILKSKDPKVNKYLHNGHARHCWLILHHEDDKQQEYIDPRLVHMMRQTAATIPHNFDKILILISQKQTIEI